MKLPKIHFESKETKSPLAKGPRNPKLKKAAKTCSKDCPIILAASAKEIPQSDSRTSVITHPVFMDKIHNFKKKRTKKNSKDGI